jgi:hypothetical protein
MPAGLVYHVALRRNRGVTCPRWPGKVAHPFLAVIGAENPENRE